MCKKDHIDRLRSPVFGAKTPSVLQRLDFERSFQVCIKEFSRFKVERRLEGKRFFLIKIQKCPSRRCLLTSYASKQRRKELFFFLISFSWWVIRINLVSCSCKLKMNGLSNNRNTLWVPTEKRKTNDVFCKRFPHTVHHWCLVGLGFNAERIITKKTRVNSARKYRKCAV